MDLRDSRPAPGRLCRKDPAQAWAWRLHRRCPREGLSRGERCRVRLPESFARVSPVLGLPLRCSAGLWFAGWFGDSSLVPLEWDQPSHSTEEGRKRQGRNYIKKMTGTRGAGQGWSRKGQGPTCGWLTWAKKALTSPSLYSIRATIPAATATMLPVRMQTISMTAIAVEGWMGRTGLAISLEA